MISQTLAAYYRWHRSRPFRSHDKVGRPLMASAKSSLHSARKEFAKYGAALMHRRALDSGDDELAKSIWCERSKVSPRWQP